MRLATSALSSNPRVLSTLCLSLFSAWLLGFPFEGPVLAALVQNAGVDGSTLSLSAVLAHFLGLFCCGFFVKKIAAVKMTMIIATVTCLSGSMIFFLPFSMLWYISITAMSFFAGLVIASWGFYFQSCSGTGERLKTAADVLILTNLIVLVINILTVSTTAHAGLILAMASLIAALFLIFRLDEGIEASVEKTKPIEGNSSVFYKPLVFLCFFIFILTINSGLMYAVVIPAFAEYRLLTGYYWVIPYLLAIILLRNLSLKVNKAYAFYIAMAMIGLSFISFMWLERSVTSYLIVNTLMMGAFGVCDLFWWSIIGSFLDFSDKPSQVFGIALSMNVLGIFTGGFIGSRIMSSQADAHRTSVLALIIVFIVLIMLPVLNLWLTKLIKSHGFLVGFAEMNEREQPKVVTDNDCYKMLTEKETEVVKLLLKGYTYKGISECLHISENTMKYHIKNIYQKLNINSKMELIKVFSDKRD